MTLDTRIYVLDRVAVGDVFAECQRLLSCNEGTRTDDLDGYRKDGSRILENCPGQGLPAWLMVYYRPDAPLATDQEAATCTEDCEPDDDYHHHPRACWLEVSFDTAYGFKGERGESCTELHTLLIAQLGKWLDARGVRWRWKDEYSGDVWDGYEGLEDFARHGRSAGTWFRERVVPVLGAI